MNHHPIIDNWKQLKFEAKRQWSRLSDDHLCQIEGNRDKLSKIVQKIYRVEKEQAEKHIQLWEQACRKRNAA